MNGRRFAGVRRLFRLPESRDSIRAAIEDEIRFHLECRTAELVRHGMAPAAARELAEREYGDVDASRAELASVDERSLTHQRREEVLVSFAQDLRYAARGLVNRPSLAMVTTLTLALGIGANAVMFGVVDQLLLRPPAHVVAPQGLRNLYYRERSPEWLREQGEFNTTNVTFYAMVDAMRRVPSFDVVAATARTSYVHGRGLQAEPLPTLLVDGGYFPLVGVRPALGRFFTPAETAIPRGENVVVVSDGFWRSRLGGDPTAIGRTVTIEDKPFTLVGVTPPGFTGLDRAAETDLWIPMSAVASAGYGDDWYHSGNSYWLQGFARLKPGADPRVAADHASQVYRQTMRATATASSSDSLGVVVLGSIRGTVTADGLTPDARVTVWLLGVSAIVLLIAAANVANLLIARSVQRRREIAVRLALGVSRGRLVRQLMTEALLLAAVAGVIALIAAHWAGRAVQAVLLPGFAWSESVVDPRVLGFTAVVMLVTAVLSGLAPALNGLRTDVTHALKAGSRETTGSRSLLRRGLLVTQAALSVVLLVGSALFVRSLSNVRSLDVGIDLDRAMIVGMNLTRAGYDTGQQRAIRAAALQRLRGIPGVERATLVGGSVPMRLGNATSFRIPGVDSTPIPQNGGPYYSAIDTAFFATIGARMVRGRDLEPGDSRAAVINPVTAEFYWPGQDPIGRCVRLGGDAACTTIVGVVQDIVLFRLVGETRAMIYLPHAHPAMTRAPSTLILRAAGADREVIAAARRELQLAAPAVSFVSVRPFQELVADQIRPWKLGATMFSLFGAIALLIAAIGLYSVMAYWVSQRTWEIGVRVALGAQRGDITRLVAGEAARTLAIGLALGVAIAWAAAPFAEDLLLGVSPRSPGVYVTVVAVLALAGIAATLLPLRRSTRIDPVTALRSE